MAGFESREYFWPIAGWMPQKVKSMQRNQDELNHLHLSQILFPPQDFVSSKSSQGVICVPVVIRLKRTSIRDVCKKEKVPEDFDEVSSLREFRSNIMGHTIFYHSHHHHYHHHLRSRIFYLPEGNGRNSTNFKYEKIVFCYNKFAYMIV